MLATVFRRLSRFSLRGLLIGMTLACVMMGIWSVYVGPYRNQSLALAQMRSQCAEWSVEPADGPPWQRWLVEKMLGDRHFTHVVGLNLSKCQAPEEQVAAVSNFPWLRTLRLDHSSLNDENSSMLASLRELESVTLSYTGISDNGIRRLTSAKQFKEIYLTGVPITDESISALESLEKLQHLFIRWTRITPTGAQQLRQALPQCEIVYHALSLDDAEKKLSGVTVP